MFNLDNFTTMALALTTSPALPGFFGLLDQDGNATASMHLPPVAKLTEEQAMGMVVNGFIEPITRTLPMEYAVEWSRLIELQMEGSVG